MKTRLIFLLPLLWLLIGCEDSEPESKPDSTDPPLIEYHYELPVVFHVLYQNEQQNIKKGRIQDKTRFVTAKPPSVSLKLLGNKCHLQTLRSISLDIFP